MRLRKALAEETNILEVRAGRMLSAGRVGIVLLLMACIALPGCGTRRKDVAYAPSSFNVEPDVDLTYNQQQRFAPADVITVSVFRAPEISGDYHVDGLGKIMMPLVGTIPVQGMTIEEFTADLHKRLDGKYYVNPDISVTLKESPNSKVTLTGAVASPGLYAIPGRTTLMRALAMANGPGRGANVHRVIVFRQIQGQRMVAGFDLKEIQDNHMEDPAIYASDIIVVDGDAVRTAFGNVLSTIPILALFRPFLY